MGEWRRFVFFVGEGREGPIRIAVSVRPYEWLAAANAERRDRPLEMFWVYPCPKGYRLLSLLHRILRRHALDLPAAGRAFGEGWYDVGVERVMAALWIATQQERGDWWTDRDIALWKGHIGFREAGDEELVRMALLEREVVDE